MSFLTEWTLAVHRAVWFPLLWMTGLEGTAVGETFLDEATTATPANNVDATANCPGCRSARPSRNHRHGVGRSPSRVVRRA